MELHHVGCIWLLRIGKLHVARVGRRWAVY